MRILVTAVDYSSHTHKWVDTQIKGSLRLVNIKHDDIIDMRGRIPPFTKLRIYNEEEDMIFEYELPISAQSEKNLNARLYAIKAIKGHWIGCLFASSGDKDKFAQDMFSIE